jgi:two-component system invasion response regulator UvrY
MKVKTLIVDNQEMILYGLRSMLEGARGIRIIGEAKSGHAAVAFALEKKPDVIIMALSLPDLNGFKVTEKILKKQPHTKIIALSMHADKWNIQRAVDTGMCGYIVKNCTPDELATAIHNVFADGAYFSKEILNLIERENVKVNKNLQVLLDNNRVGSATSISI